MRQGTRKDYLKGTRRHGPYKFHMEKFLHSRLGKQWSKIHSELSQEFDRRTYAGNEFWRNFGGYCKAVEEKCWIGAETGTVYTEIGNRVEGFYVHPKTGCLQYQKRPVRNSYPGRPVTHYKIDDKRAYDKIDGIWYYTKYIENTLYNPKYATSGLYENQKYLLKSQRQLSRKELKANNLVNDTPEEIRVAKLKAAEEARKLRAKQEETIANAYALANS